MAKVTTPELLGLTAEQYENEFISLYMRWIEQFSTKVSGQVLITDLQLLMANSSISKWYNERHSDLENQAISILRPQHCRITIAQAKAIYGSVMAEIFRTFPRPLFEQARKLTITNN